MLKKLQNIQAVINYRRMWPFIKPYWFRSLIAMLLCFPVGSLDAFVAWCLKHFMDDVLNNDGASSSSAWIVPIAIVGITILQGALTYSVTYLNAWLGNRMANDMREALFGKLVSFEPGFFDRQNSGDIVFRFHSDANEACSGVLDNVRLFVTRVFSSISLMFVLLINSWQLTLITIVVLGCTFYPVTRIRNMIKKVMRGTVNVMGMTVTTMNEVFAGNKTVAAYNAQPEFGRRYDSILKEMFRLSIKMTQKTAWLLPVMHITTSIGIAVAIGYGSFLIVEGQLTTGEFVSFLAAMLMLYNPLKNIGNQYNKIMFSFMAIERVFEMLDRKPA
ncbi:MAG: ABC transporter transmembrane domain-containing protein, partial [Oxalobacter sp.]